MNFRFPGPTTLIPLLFLAITASTQLAAQPPQAHDNDHPSAVRFATLVNFDNTNGGNPAGPLIQGRDRNLYGTTGFGGSRNAGTFFKMSPQGELTTVHDFCSQLNCTDGRNPSGTLVLGIDSNFYGITSTGGANEAGTVFKITPGGVLTTIYNWCSQPLCADGFYGSFPESGTFVQARDGNFYGTTSSGGINPVGTFFKMSPRGELTTLYNFCSQPNCADGLFPTGLVQATDGNFYGTTVEGGANTAGANGGGTVFRITREGVLTTLYNFCSQTGCTDGSFPIGPLIQARDGSFYGTTTAGGTHTNPVCFFFSFYPSCGTAFKVTSKGVLTTLYNFCSLPDCADGAVPRFGLMQAADDNFYGSTAPGVQVFGTPSSDGITVFRMTRKGKLTTLHTFDQIFQTPQALIQGTNRNIYGVTLTGGTNEGCGSFFSSFPSCGTVFQLAVCGDEDNQGNGCEDQSVLKSPALRVPGDRP